MMYLSQLSPAETLFLTDEKATLKDFLKITLLDLILKKVLKTVEVTRTPSLAEGTLVYTYITTGANFKTHIFKKHEEFFTATFVGDEDFQILFRNLVKIGFQKASNRSYFSSRLLKTKMFERCFTQNFFQKIFNLYNTTSHGHEFKRIVKKELDDLNKQFPNKKSIDHQKVIKLISVIGANLFLLKNIDYELLNTIDSELSVEMNKKETNGEFSSGCSGCAWIGFESYSSDFDSGCSSSFGGDSGCSGCGGCGGCGGCS